MENKQLPIVALVDDDYIFQLTASRTIQTANLAKQILQFEDGEVALHFLRENASDKNVLPDVIFLDINMPFVDGWMFLQDFVYLKLGLSKSIIIYMVSSSIDPNDINKSKQYLEVKDYVIKPISREKYIELFTSVINTLN